MFDKKDLYLLSVETSVMEINVCLLDSDTLVPQFSFIQAELYSRYSKKIYKNIYKFMIMVIRNHQSGIEILTSKFFLISTYFYYLIISIK